MTHGPVCASGRGEMRLARGREHRARRRRGERASGGRARRDAAGARRRSASARVGGTGAHGFLYERHRLEVTRAPLAVSGLPGCARRPSRSASSPICIAARSSRTSSSPARCALLMQEHPDLDRPRRRLRHRRRSPLSSSRSPRRSRRCRRRTVSSPCSATTTTTATCRRRCEQRGFEVLRDARTRLTVRGEALDLIGIRYWTRQAGEIDAGGARRGAGDRCFSRTRRRGSPKRRHWRCR